LIIAINAGIGFDSPLCPRNAKTLWMPLLQKKSLIIILPIIILAIAGYFFWRHFKYEIANKTIHNAINEKSKGLYRIHYDSIMIDEVAGTMEIRNISLTPDSSVYEALRKSKKNPPVLVYCQIPRMLISGVKTPKAILDKELVAGKIEIDSPRIDLGILSLLRDTSGYNPAKDITNQILGNLTRISIDSINLRHGYLRVHDIRDNKEKFNGIDLSFNLIDLQIDSLSRNDENRILYSKNLELNCESILVPSRDKKYKFLFDGLSFTSQTASFQARKIAIIPQLGEEAFAHSFKKQNDRFDLVFNDIILKHIDLKSLWQKKLLADTLRIPKSTFKVYRDISMPLDSTSKVGNYPQQLLMRIQMPIFIKRIIFDQSLVIYKEKNGKTDSSGSVRFNSVKAGISNVTNIKSEIARNNHCVLDFNSAFLGRCPFHAKWTMFLNDPRGRFQIEASLGQMPAAVVNQLTIPMTLVRMDKGNINQLELDFLGENLYAEGPLLFAYDGLGVSVFKKNKEENSYQKKGLTTLAANLIIRNSNPDNGKLRRVRIRNERDIYRSVFNLMWKTTFKGLKETVLITK
jgi:hypothetical protein